MKEKIQSIKLNGMLCIIFTGITYLVTLNIENGIFHPNWWWMSNDFALTVSGGIATGFVAGLAYAIHDYKNAKNETELELFRNVEWLYSTLKHIDETITAHLNKPDWQAAPTVFDNYISEGKATIEKIRKIDYQTLFAKTELEQKLQSFQKTECDKMQEIFRQAFYYYRIAINLTEIDNLKNDSFDGLALTSDYRIKRTLEILQKEVLTVLPSIEQLAEVTDLQTGQYHWKEYKKYVDDNCSKVTELDGFEEFLKKGDTL